MLEPFSSGLVEPDVMCRPADAERVAAGGELSNEIGELLVVRVPTSFGAQDRHGGISGFFPVGVELVRAVSEEAVPSQVRRSFRRVEDGRVERSAKRVDRQDVEAAVADKRDRGGHRVEHVLDAVADLLGSCLAARFARTVAGGTSEVEQVGAFGLVKLKCS